MQEYDRFSSTGSTVDDLESRRDEEHVHVRENYIFEEKPSSEPQALPIETPPFDALETGVDSNNEDIELLCI